VFFAEVTEQGATALDEDEHIEPVILSETEMDEIIRKGGVSDAKTLAAWMLYKARRA
jgi:hypothetical protein